MNYRSLGNGINGAVECIDTLANILAATDVPAGSKAAPTDVTGCTLQYDGSKWSGNVGICTFAYTTNLPIDKLANGTTIFIGKFPYSVFEGNIRPIGHQVSGNVNLSAESPTITASNTLGYSYQNDYTSGLFTIEDQCYYSSGTNRVAGGGQEFIYSAYKFSVWGNFVLKIFMNYPWRLFVDGDEIDTTGVTLSASMNQISVEFTKAKYRQIEVRAFELYSVLTKYSGMIAPRVKNSDYRNALVIGDSWIIGGNPDSYQSQNWIWDIKRRLGYDNLFCDGESGTGYIRTNGAAHEFSDTSRIESYASFINEYDLADIFVAGSLNDSSYYAESDALISNATKLFTALQANFPHSRIFCIGPQFLIKNSSWILACETAIFSAAAAMKIPTLSTNGWFTGTGNSSANTGDGNRDIFIGSTSHPTALGQKYIADKIISGFSSYF